MTGLREQILAAETGFDLLGLDPEYIGSCPCAKVEGDGIVLEMNCWRTHQWYPVENAKCDHDYVCAHIWGAADLVPHIKRLLDGMDWYGEWAVEVENRAAA